MPSNEGIIRSVKASPIRVLVVGGSYGGLSATGTLLDICNGKRCRFAGDDEAAATPSVVVPVEVTIVDERDGFYHLIGSPLSFASKEYGSNAWRKYSDIAAVQNGQVKIIQGSVVNVDPASRSATILEHQTARRFQQTYDYAVISTGLGRKYPAVPQSLDRASYLAEIGNHIDSVRSATRGVVVIGGGAVGVEMAAELKLIEPTLNITLVHSRDKLLSAEKLPDEFKDKTLDLTRESGVNVILNDRVTSVTDKTDEAGKKFYELILQDGSHIEAGHVINAVSGFHPTTSFLPQTTLDEEGYIKVEASLQFIKDSPNASRHFAAGDIAKWSGIKRCGAAMHQGHFVGVNIYQQILEEQQGLKLERLQLGEVPPMIGLAVGKQAVTYNQVEGVMFGEDRMKLYFEDDLGFGICWKYMRLGEAQ